MNEPSPVHDLKVWPEWFADMADRRKEFELRPDDRGINAGDWLVLREWDPETGEFSGRRLIRNVRYVLRGEQAEQFGLKPGFCVLGLSHSETDPS